MEDEVKSKTQIDIRLPNTMHDSEQKKWVAYKLSSLCIEIKAGIYRVKLRTLMRVKKAGTYDRLALCLAGIKSSTFWRNSLFLGGIAFSRFSLSIIALAQKE